MPEANDQPHILVVGGGSIGQRHIKNLLSLGAAVSLVEPVKDLLPVEGMTAGHRNIEAALGMDSHDFDSYIGAIVAVPTHLHAECALPLLRLGLPVLIEKPLAHTVESAELLRPYANQIRVGYSMRNSPPIECIKQHLYEIGKVLHFQATVGQDLRQWHPNESYTSWYMSFRKQGGGAALDLSHELDYAQYLVAPVNEAVAFVGHVDKTLEITSDDLFNAMGWLGQATRFTVHTDLIDREYNRKVRILGERGTIDWDHVRGTVRVNGSEITYDADRNIQFMREAELFLDWSRGGAGGNLATFQNAFYTLEVVEALVLTGHYKAEAGAPSW